MGKRNARIGRLKPKDIEVGKRTQKRKKNRRKNLILNILLIVFLVIFIYSSYNVFMWIKSDRKLKKLESGLYKDVIEEVKNNNDSMEQTNENSDEIKATYSVDFKKLKEINKDVIGWIKINDTYINYPILQGKEDEYYLKKDLYKSYDYSGSIFVYSNINPFEDENTAIFGHNMNNQRMFANLQKIYDGELGTNIDVEICTEEKNHIYKVFSCYIETPNLDIIKNQFSVQEKEEYINRVLKKSVLDFHQEIDYSKKLITLVTCGSSSKNRIVVHAIESGIK